MNRCCKHIFFSFLVFFFCTAYSGNSQEITFENITLKDGLPSPNITAIFKDSYGFMWFGP